MKDRLRRFVSQVAWTAFVAIAGAAPTVAMEGIQSPYLKGYRDFSSGVLPPPGVQWRHDFYMYSGTERSSIPQGQLSVAFKGVANILGATIVTPYQILGGHYAFALRGAYSDISADQTLTPPRPRPMIVRSAGLDAFNDVVVSPFIVGWHSGPLHWNVATSVWLPVGSYDKSRLTNTGRNAWALAPQVAATYLDPKSGLEFSGATVYVINFMNTATNYRSGDIAHFDFAVGQMLSPQFKLGMVGYYAQQITADSGPGAIFGDRKLRVAALGPGATFTFVVNKVPMNVVAKYYREFSAQNTTQGDAGSLSVRVRF